MKKFITFFAIVLIGICAIATAFTTSNAATNQDSYIEYNITDYFTGSISMDHATQIYKLLPLDIQDAIITAYYSVSTDSRSNFTYNDVKVKHVNNDWYFDYKGNSIIAHNVDLTYLNTIIKRRVSE